MRAILLIFIFFNVIRAFCEPYADKQFYLVDSLDLSTLAKIDLQLVDSCLRLYHSATTDTSAIFALNGICENMMHEDWGKFQHYQHVLIEKALAKGPVSDLKHKLLIAYAGSLNNLGYIKGEEGNISSQLNYYLQSLEVNVEIGNEQGESIALSNLAYIHEHQGDIPKSLSYYEQSLAIQERIGFKKGMGYSLNNMAFIYKAQGDTENAIKYNLKSLALRKQVGIKSDIATSLNNLAVIYDELGEHFKALEQYQESLPILVALGDKEGIAMTYNNIGKVYSQLDNPVKTLEYYNMSLALEVEINNKHGIAISLVNIGRYILKQNKISEAITYGNEALALGEQIGYAANISDASQLLYQAYNLANEPELALKNYERHITFRDSLNNEKTQKATIRQQTKYEFEKANLLELQVQNEALRVKNEELQRRDNLQYSVILIALLIVFGIVLSIGFIKVSPKVAEGLIFFSFLILFEFALVLADPYVDKFSGGAPGYKLLFNAVLAGLIFPLHSYFERVLRLRLIKKAIN